MIHSLRQVLLTAALLSSCDTPRQFSPFPAATSLHLDGGMLDVEWVDDFAFVDVVIDGKACGRFLLDTGASVVLVAPRVVEALGLPRVVIDRARGGRDLPGANASSTTIEHVVPIRELRSGPLTMRDFDAMELDTTMLTRVLGRPVDGVLPATAFRDVRLTIDYAGRRIVVGPAAPLPAATPGVLPLLPGSLPVVSWHLADAVVQVLLDTGSSAFLTLPEGVPLGRRGEPVETGRQQTVGGTLPVRQVRIDGSLDWAGHTLVSPVVELGRGSRGAVGAALLRHFQVELDQPNRVVRFLRHSPAPLPSPPVRSTGLGFLPGETHWTVGYVLDASPAAQSGFRVGDEVEAIDGVPASRMRRSAYEQLVAERDVVRLRVRTGDRVRDVDVPVAVLVP